MEAQSVHKHCLRIKFGAQSKMPTDREIFAFFRKRLWLPEMLNAMFREPRDFSVYVKFQTEQLMTAELLKCPATDEFTYTNGDSVSVTFAVAKGNFKYVRLFGIPIEVEDVHIVNAISKYGMVHKVIREKYGLDTGYPILNGVRGVYLEVSKVIPAQIYIQNFTTRVSYEGMERKCFSCGNVDHVKQDCPKRIPVNDKLNSTSYSAVLLSRSSSSENQLKMTIKPNGNIDQASDFSPLETLSQSSKTKSAEVSVQEQQSSSSGTESMAKELLSSSVVSLMTQKQASSFRSDMSSNEQVSSGVVQAEGKSLEIIDQKETARKREHEEISDAMSETSGSVENPQQEAELVTFKVPGINNLLEKQMKATKLRTKSKKSKKITR